MNLQPSLSISYNDRRSLFSDELRFGGHGQRYLSGGGTYTPSTSEYVFYKIDFLTDSVVSSAVFRNVNDRGDSIYQVNNSSAIFAKNSTWNAPLTSITLSSGTAIAYQYKKFIPEDLLYINCIESSGVTPAPLGNPYPGETLSSMFFDQWFINGIASGSPGFTFIIPESTLPGSLITVGNSFPIVVLAYNGWVSVDGNDSADGTYNNPWASLSRIITFAQGAAQIGTLTLSDVSGTAVTATRSSAGFSVGDVGKSLHAANGTGAATITGYTSATEVTIRVTTPFAATSVTSGQWVVSEMLDGVTSRIRIKAGTYTNQSCNIVRYGAAPGKTTRLNITSQSGVNVVWALGTDMSCFQAGGNFTFDCSGYGGTISGFNVGTGNGIGASETATMIGRGWSVSDCVDGISAHNSSRIEGYDLTISNCSKSAFAHINTTQSYHYRCTMTGKSGASAGIGQMDIGCTHYSEDCSYIPIANGQSMTLLGTYVRTKIGTTSASIFFGGHETISGVTATDCYLNLQGDGRYPGTFTRCYGKVSLRCRGTVSNPDLQFINCIFVGGASGAATNGLFANFDSDATWQGVGYLFRDCILKGYTTAIGSGFSSNQFASFNGNSAIDHCCFYSNTTNIHASITIATGTVIANPFIGAANTTVQSDYGFTSGSPCIGAGTGGTNIGFPA